MFTADTLDRLPKYLKLEAIIMTQVEQMYVFWCKCAEFMINGIEVNCSERLLCCRAAKLFKDKDTAAAIIKGENLRNVLSRSRFKALGKNRNKCKRNIGTIRP